MSWFGTGTTMLTRLQSPFCLNLCTDPKVGFTVASNNLSLTDYTRMAGMQRTMWR